MSLNVFWQDESSYSPQFWVEVDNFWITEFVNVELLNFTHIQSLKFSTIHKQNFKSFCQKVLSNLFEPHTLPIWTAVRIPMRFSRFNIRNNRSVINFQNLASATHQIGPADVFHISDSEKIVLGLYQSRSILSRQHTELTIATDFPRQIAQSSPSVDWKIWFGFRSPLDFDDSLRMIGHRKNRVRDRTKNFDAYVCCKTVWSWL